MRRGHWESAARALRGAGWVIAALCGAGLFALLPAHCGSDATPPRDAGVAVDAPPAVDVAPADVTTRDVLIRDVPDGAPRVTLETYPRIDGSTSTLPLARVIACELLGLGYRWQQGLGSEGEAVIVPVAPTPAQDAFAEQVARRIAHSRTHQAYLNLVDGAADLILVANPPSEEELAYARDRNVTFAQRPIALDALVMIVNAVNPVAGLSTDQIRRIFTAQLTQWREVGGGDGAIHPFVRPINSGSQQLMNAIVMGGVAMPDWPEDRTPTFMGALIDNVMRDPLAIGYSVYYFVTYQYVSAGYRVLAVDGITPTATTIGARRYPFNAPVLSVVRADLSPSSLAYQLRDWLLTPDGQRTIARSGYVPITP